MIPPAAEEGSATQDLGCAADMYLRPSAELLAFPCDHLFKAFGPNDPEGEFARDVRAAVSDVIPTSLDAIKVRPSSGGIYLCVTVMVRLRNFAQLEAIYAALRRVKGMKYLL